MLIFYSIISGILMIFLVISLLDDKPPASNDNPERGPYPTPIQMSKHKPNHRMTTIHPLTPEPESTSSPSLSLKFKLVLESVVLVLLVL